MASALEHYVNNVRSFSSLGNFRELIEYLNGTSDLLAKNGNILDNVLETLDVQQHSLGVLHVLVAKLINFSNATSDGENIIKLVRDFIQACNGEQVRHAPQAYAELCHLFTNYIIKSGTSPIQGIKVLAHAVDKIRLFDSQLTPVHADLFQLSLCAKIFNPALKFLDIDITAISTTEDNNHDAKYFLLYYYYGGMIYSAIKNYERALYFFEVAVSTPALAMSYIMLESYKKYILVSLILEGKISSIPKYSSQVITRFVKPLSHAYHDLATAYETSQSDEIRNVINKYREVFVRDMNFGLVKQVAASLYKKNIQRLTQTFLTLSLVDVANKVHLNGPNEAEKYIVDMIKSGEIFASINQKDGMVVFKDDPEKYNTPEMFQSIQEDITQVMELNKQIVKMEEEIKLNPHYVKKSIGNQDEDLVSCPTKSFPPNDQME
ncbi:COP9 signalosome complex subunit 3 [Contarinia nasturtii]|uniref:COP9 signalosome complex subunit 3 n=1 Tax=Contarinia nasturtii TaxID=265458 RepID=UPI0012D48F3E|nr:COP9 signalosome complex subunit 3 [Contarinia nasturtii]